MQTEGRGLRPGEGGGVWLFDRPDGLSGRAITAGAEQGVGAATTAAVVSASILILAFDYVLTEMFFAR